MSDDAAAKLALLGLDERKIKDTVANKKLTASLLAAIDESGLATTTTTATSTQKSTSIGPLLYNLAAKLPADGTRFRGPIARLIVSEKIKNQVQLDGALDYVKATPLSVPVNDAALEQAAGVGVTVTREDIERTLRGEMDAARAAILTSRYRTNAGPFLGAVRKAHKFADGALVKQVYDELLASMLGPMTEDDKKPPEPQKKGGDSKTAAAAAANVTSTTTTTSVAAPKSFESGSTLPDAVLYFLPPPTANKQNTPELLEQHLKATGGMVVTRFPPEPNGYLHIGHAKAMNLDFGYAARMGGKCYMRFDDTNPQKEKQEYIDSILDSIKWLGHTPCAVTHSSDYFPQLYEYARKLIAMDCAYVDHSTADEMKEQREKKLESKWRNRPVEESLRLFEDMKKGKFAEGAATLRLKCDMKSPNPVMRDLVAYRIKYTPHPKTGDTWCIYPSYDYTHCICDSIENITHSLCTLEFDVRREVYNWILDKLGLYRPPQIEFSRLNLTYMMMSKRRLNTLVDMHLVRGWTDPRMPTIEGFRRRGYTSEAINDFCERIGITRNAQVLDISYLEQCLRLDLDKRVPRAMAVLYPLKVRISNWKGGVEQREVPNHPTLKEHGTRSEPFGEIVYIDRSDFRLEDSSDFYGLAPGKEVGLKYAYNIKCTDVVRDADGNVVELVCTYDPNHANKPKGHLQWVAESPLARRCEVRLYERLFVDETPGDKENWLELLNPNSEVIVQYALVGPGVPQDVKKGDKFQFERLGYFCVDTDSKPDHLVFNRTVPLKDTAKKAAEKHKGDKKAANK